MTTNAQMFLNKLQDPAFRAAFASADAAGRQQLLDQTGIIISLSEAETIFANQSDELSEADLEKAAGGDYGIILPPPDTDD